MSRRKSKVPQHMQDQVHMVEAIDSRNMYSGYGMRSATPIGNKNDKFSNKYYNEPATEVLKRLKIDTERSVNISKGGEGMGSNRRAFNKIKAGSPIAVYDIENLGMPKMGKAYQDDEPLFGITQISFGLSKSVEELKKGNTNVENFVFAQSKEVVIELNQMLDSLEADYHSYHDLDERQKGTLADLVTFANEELFGNTVEIEGKSFKTLPDQDAPLSINQTNLTDIDNIKLMRQGLSNLQNPDFTNKREEIGNVIDIIAGTKATRVGHNILKHDDPAVIQELKAINASQRAINYMHEPAFDTHVASQRYLNKKGAPKTPDHRLGTVYEHLTNKPHGEGTAHNAAFDVRMNAAIFGELYDITEEQEGDFQFQKYSPGDKFQVDRGLVFRESDYNKNKGQYDIVTKKNPETGKMELQYDEFRRGTGRGDREMKFLGLIKPLEIDGITHFGASFYNEEEDIYHNFLRTSLGDIDDIFEDHMIEADSMPKDKAAYIRKDRARRRYVGLFTDSAKNDDDTVIKRLEQAHDIVNIYEEQKKNVDMSLEDVDNVLIDMTMEAVNKDREFPLGRNRIEDMISIAPRLKEEKEMWDRHGLQAKSTTSISDSARAQTEKINMYFSEIFNTYSDLTEEESYGHSTLEMMKLPGIGKEEKPTYRNVGSDGQVKSMVRNELNKDADRAGKGKTGVHFERLMNTMGEDIQDEEKNHLMKKVHNDLRKGKVSSGTVDEISDAIIRRKEIIKNNGHIVNSVPGFSMEKAFSSSILQGGEDLIGRDTTELEKEISQKTADFVNQKIARGSGAAYQGIKSNELLSSFKKARDVQKTLRDSVLASNNRLGSAMGKQKIFKDTSPQEEIERLINNFESEGFHVRLEQVEGSERVNFFATPQKNIKFSEMSFSELEDSPFVFSSPLPLHNERMAIPTVSGDMMDMQHLRLNHKKKEDGTLKSKNLLLGDVEIESTADVINRQLNYSAKNIKEAINKGETIEESIRSAQSSLYQVTSRSGIPSSYHSQTSEMGYEATSVQKNRHLLLNANEYLELYAKEHHEDNYLKFLENKRTGFSENIMDAFGSGERFAFRVNASDAYNSTIGAMTGTHFYAEGLNPNQASSGIVSMMPPQTNLPYQQYHSGVREQANKAINYRTMNEDSLKKKTQEIYGIDSVVSDLSIAPAQDMMANIVEEEGVVAFEIDVMRIGNEDLAKGSKEYAEILREERNALIKKGSLTKEESEKVTSLKRSIDFITSGALSTFEDEGVAAESFLTSLQSSEFLEIELNEYSLDPYLENEFRDRLGVSTLEKGRYELEDPFTFKELQDMGVVDGDGILTVGQYMEDVVINQSAENPSLEYGEAKRRKMQAGGNVYGIEVGENGATKLLMDNKYVGGSSHKVVGKNTGTRQTFIGAPDELISGLGRFLGANKDVQGFIAHEKLGEDGRRAYGSALADPIATSARNIGHAIDELYETGESSLDSVNEYFGKGVSGDAKADYADYIQNVFVDEVNITMGGEQIKAIQKEGHQFEFRQAALDGTNEEKFEALKGIHNLAINKYGMQSDERIAVTSYSASAHAINYWQGTDKNVRIGQVELDMIDRYSRGPSENELESIRKMGVVDGVDYSDFTSPRRLEGESLLVNSLNDMAGSVGTLEEQKEYARIVKSASETHSQQLGFEDIKGGGNVIVDIEGDYEFSDTSNYLTIGEGDDQYHVVDPTSIKVAPGGLPTGKDMEGTYSNIHSVQLYDEDKEFTVGDLVKEQNSKTFVRLMDADSRLAQDAQLQNEVVEVIPMLSGHKKATAFQTEAELNQSRAFEIAYELSHGGPGEGEDASIWTKRKIEAMEKNMNQFFEATGKFVGGEAARKFVEVTGENSFVFGLQGRNILTSKYRVQDATFNEKQARKLMLGRQDTILKANEINHESILDFAFMGEDEFSELTSNEQLKIKEDYIVERLSGTVDEDDPFEFFALLGRDPVQDEGSFGVGSVRIDNTLGDRDGFSGSLDSRAAKEYGGDHDGDNMKTSAYHYAQDMSSSDAIAMQKELREHAELSGALAIRNNHQAVLDDMAKESENTWNNLITTDSEERIAQIFKENIGGVDSIVQILSDESMIADVGKIYNTVVGVRDALGNFTDAAMTMDDSDEMHSEMRDTYKQGKTILSNIQQNSISRKKIEVPQIIKFAGLGEEHMTEAGAQKLHDQGKFLDLAIAFDQTRSSIPKRIEDMTTDTAPGIFEDIQRLSILEYGEDDLEQKQIDFDSFMGIATFNEALKASPIGGFNNPAYRHGFSTSNENRNAMVELIKTDPAQVPVTGAMKAAAKVFYGEESEEYSNWMVEAPKVMENVVENYERINERVKNQTTDFQISDNLIKQLSQAKQASSHGDRIRSQSGMYNQIMDAGSTLVKSSKFQVGAGVAAAWMVSRAVRKGPTPEGNEAEMEAATPQEIAPSQLLTSPTARVTPGAEGVNLNINGYGNVGEQEIAGIVNNEIAQMTGRPMEMNINVSDNTAKLDNRFYEQSVNKAFGM